MALWVRSGGRCERCGDPLRSEGVERHHRLRRRDGGDRLANLMLIHSPCHRWITEHPTEAKANGWIVPPDGPDPGDVPVRLPGGALWLLRDDGGKTPVP